MKRLSAYALLLAGFATLAVVVAPTFVWAGTMTAHSSGMRTSASGGICRSGKKVKDAKTCKENGGKYWLTE